MALDTKYRPFTYGDVLGQEAAVSVLRQFVKEGKGFHQSYVFCGQHGSGKTTLGRILARALLCSNPNEGEPCDECESCRIFLVGGIHEGFEELDAASKSGKGDLTRIIEDLAYSTFNGKRRIYLFDESHRLSKQALDILLKPMEDNVEGAEDKQLVCIFCTTEPEKMRHTIFSRCAPAFVVRAVDPDTIAGRLAEVCESEAIEYDRDALVTIADVAECHIRDALKTVEGVSMLGKITRETTFKYLQLGANDMALDLLEAIGTNLSQAVAFSGEMAQTVSPASAYARLSEGAMCAYRSHLGVGKVPSQWNHDRVRALGDRGSSLLGIASRFAAPPHRPTRHTLVLDVATAHYATVTQTSPSEVATLRLEVSTAPQEVEKSPRVSEAAIIPEETQATGTVVSDEPTAKRNEAGVWVDPRAIGKGPSAAAAGGSVDVSGSSPPPLREPVRGSLGPELFRNLVQFHLKQDLSDGRKGQSG